MLTGPDGQNCRLLDLGCRAAAWIRDYENEENHNESSQPVLTS